MLQLQYNDYCFDEALDSTKPMCPTNKPMLRYAMTEDADNLQKVRLLQEKYKSDDNIKEQVYQYPVQINSLKQLLLRLRHTKQFYQS